MFNNTPVLPGYWFFIRNICRPLPWSPKCLEFTNFPSTFILKTDGEVEKKHEILEVHKFPIHFYPKN